MPSKAKPEQGPTPQAYAEHQDALMELSKEPVRLTDPKAVESRASVYFDLCATSGVKPTLPGLAMAFGVTVPELARNPTSQVIRSVMAVENMNAQMAQDGKIPMAIYIFQAKNWFGYRDQSDVRITGTSKRASAKEIESRYEKVRLVEHGPGNGRVGGRGRGRGRALPGGGDGQDRGRGQGGE